MTTTPVHDTFGNIIPDLSNGGTTDLGEIDRNWTQSRSLGASGQAVDTAKVYGHDNTLTVGASLDYGWTRFTGNSQLGIVPGFVNNSLPVIGLPYIIDEPDSFLNPVVVHANNTYAGVYALDTFSVTDRLTVTAGARFNYAGISLDGQNNALLNGYLELLPRQSDGRLHLQAHAGHQLLCGICDDQSRADAARAWLRRSQQPLHHRQLPEFGPETEAGRRPDFRVGFPWAERLQPIWSGAPMGQAAMVGRAFPHDARPTTFCRCRARLTALAITRMSERPCARARRSAPNGPATGGRLTPITPISTPSISRPSRSRRRFNPIGRTPTANIPITNGTQIAGIPKNTVKVGVDYAVTDKWRVGADMVAASGQVIFGNENSALPQVPGYAIFGLHTSYQVGKQVPDLWLRPEHLRSAFLYRRRFVRHHVVPQRGAEPDRSAQASGRQASRHLRRDADHVVMRWRDIGGTRIC